MNLFFELEGLSGEEMGSAGLRLLLLRSLPIRLAVLKFLSAASPIGPLRTDSHFSSYREFPTVDEDERKGRLDLVIEVDGAVVGIESKFQAAFTEEQPKKYQSTLTRIAKGLTEARGASVQHCTFVLGPEARRKEIVEHIASIATARFVAWEDLLAQIDGVHSEADDLSRYIAAELSLFVRRSLSLLPDFEDSLPHMLNSFQESGTPQQRLFLKVLSGILPIEGALSSGKEYCGFYLTKFDHGFPDRWLGFIPTSRFGGQVGKSGAVFVLALKHPIPGLSPDPAIFVPVEPHTRMSFLWTKPRYVHAKVHYKVKLDERWSDPGFVREQLMPFFAAPAAEPAPSTETPTENRIPGGEG